MPRSIHVWRGTETISYTDIAMEANIWKRRATKNTDNFKKKKRQNTDIFDSFRFWFKNTIELKWKWSYWEERKTEEYEIDEDTNIIKREFILMEK